MPSMKREPVWTSLNDKDATLIRGLAGVSFQAYSGHRRFALGLNFRATAATPRISEGERSMLCALVWRYRRQIANGVVVQAAIVLADQRARFLIERVSQHPTMPPLTVVRSAAEDLFTPRRPA